MIRHQPNWGSWKVLLAQVEITVFYFCSWFVIWSQTTRVFCRSLNLSDDFRDSPHWQKFPKFVVSPLLFASSSPPDVCSLLVSCQSQDRNMINMPTHSPSMTCSSHVGSVGRYTEFVLGAERIKSVYFLTQLIQTLACSCTAPLSDVWVSSGSQCMCESSWMCAAVWLKQRITNHFSNPVCFLSLSTDKSFPAVCLCLAPN